MRENSLRYFMSDLPVLLETKIIDNILEPLLVVEAIRILQCQLWRFIKIEEICDCLHGAGGHRLLRCNLVAEYSNNSARFLFHLDQCGGHGRRCWLHFKLLYAYGATLRGRGSSCCCSSCWCGGSSTSCCACSTCCSWRGRGWLLLGRHTTRRCCSCTRTMFCGIRRWLHTGSLMHIRRGCYAFAIMLICRRWRRCILVQQMIDGSRRLL